MNENFKQKLNKNGVSLAFLFGSQAKGFTHNNSDVDIAVLLDEKIKPKKYFDKSIELADLFKDLYPNKERQVVILNQATPLLKHEVLAGGKLLFSESDDDFIKFNLQAVHQYEDTKPIRELQYFYLQERINKNNF